MVQSSYVLRRYDRLPCNEEQVLRGPSHRIPIFGTRSISRHLYHHLKRQTRSLQAIMMMSVLGRGQGVAQGLTTLILPARSWLPLLFVYYTLSLPTSLLNSPFLLSDQPHFAMIRGFLVALCAFLLGTAQASPFVQISDNFIALPTVHHHKLNGTGSGHRLVQHDRARAQRFFLRASPLQQRAISEPVVDGVVGYTVQVRSAVKFAVVCR